jgi:hypothetical protein
MPRWNDVKSIGCETRLVTGQHSLTSDLTTLEEARRAGRYFVAKQ